MRRSTKFQQPPIRQINHWHVHDGWQQPVDNHQRWHRCLSTDAARAMSFIFDEVVNPTATWSAGYLWFANHSYGAADTHFSIPTCPQRGNMFDRSTAQRAVSSVRSKHNWRELMARFRWHDYARPRALDLGQNDSRLRWCRLPRLSSPQSKRCASCSLIPKPLVRLRRETAFGRSSCPAFPKPNHKPTYELRLGLLRCGLSSRVLAASISS
jgi:hypothetical protein